MGFFTDAYDLFVIGTVAAIVTTQWHLSTTEASWVTGAALLGAVVGGALENLVMIGGTPILGVLAVALYGLSAALLGRSVVKEGLATLS